MKISKEDEEEFLLKVKINEFLYEQGVRERYIFSADQVEELCLKAVRHFTNPTDVRDHIKRVECYTHKESGAEIRLWGGEERRVVFNENGIMSVHGSNICIKNIEFDTTDGKFEIRGESTKTKVLGFIRKLFR